MIRRSGRPRRGGTQRVSALAPSAPVPM